MGGKLDCTGMTAAYDRKGELDLGIALQFVPGQLIQLYMNGHWKDCKIHDSASGRCTVEFVGSAADGESPQLELEVPLLRHNFRVVSEYAYSQKQHLFVLRHGVWCSTIVLESPSKGATSAHVVDVDGQRMSIRLNRDNHAPALFVDQAAFQRAMYAYSIALKEEHSYLYDIFSGQKLDTRTQVRADPASCELHIVGLASRSHV
jgi:hypothetical protein